MTTRIYQNIPLQINTEIQLDKSASHHLVNVLRVKLNEEIIIFNGCGGEYSAIILNVNKKIVQAKILNFNDREAESNLNICLLQGISRGEKMDFTLQKSVELGVKKIVPLFTERCNVKLDLQRIEKKSQHWQSIITSACEQSGRNFIPILEKPQKFTDWMSENISCDDKFVLAPNANTKLNKQLFNPNKNIILLVGPEGGLTENEIKFANANSFQSIMLGPRILRTETAALVAITALQTIAGDLQ